MTLASRVLEDIFSSPWPWPCEIVNDTSKKVLMIRAKTVINVSSFPFLTRCNNASGAFLSQVWCASTSSLTWRLSTEKGRHGTYFWVCAVCPWPWPCHLCHLLHHWNRPAMIATTHFAIFYDFTSNAAVQHGGIKFWGCCCQREQDAIIHRHRSSVNFKGAPHFCPKNMYEKLSKYPIFVISARKVNKIGNFT